MPGLRQHPHALARGADAGLPQPIQYERNLYLAAGVTTARELGGNFDKTKRWRAESAAHTIVAPRMLRLRAAFARQASPTPEEIRALRPRGQSARRRRHQAHRPMDRDQLEAALDEANKAGPADDRARRRRRDDRARLRRARRQPRSSTSTASPMPRSTASQRLSAGDELRQRDAPVRPRRRALHAGRPAEARRSCSTRWSRRSVAWSPTLSIYEASRDLYGTRTSPGTATTCTRRWRRSGSRSMTATASFFIGWTSTEEVKWRRTTGSGWTRVREFGPKGGVITTGDDAGYIWSLYGFGLLPRARTARGGGFSPARRDQARDRQWRALLGLGDRLGRVRAGLHRRPARRQRQPAREPARAEPDRRRRERGRPQVARRRHRVDDQGRHSSPRADADDRVREMVAPGAERERRARATAGELQRSTITPLRAGVASALTPRACAA